VSFRQNPEILSEINQILDDVGRNTSLLSGVIIYVNTSAEYVLISTDGFPDKNFIAAREDFNPILNSLSKSLTNRNVKFIPKVYRQRGNEKRDAKNIILVD
jgi:hypothetical protein